MLNINTNIPSLIAQRSLNNSTKLLNQAIERMATGFKINHASDNAANYSISTNMTTKINSLMVAEDNTSMGLDLINTAEESLSQIQDKLERLRALQEQAANGTYGATSLNAINAEANSIVDEIERIYSTTEYNGIKVFGETNKFINPVTQLSEEEALAEGYTLIKTAEELQALSGKSGKFILMNDIDLSGYSTGEGWSPIKNFTGELNGNGYVVKNLYINRPTANNNGLFVGTGISIKNLGVENANVMGKSISGILLNTPNYNKISNCYTTGSVSVGEGLAGGLVGGFFSISASITDCYTTSSVSGKSTLGGLVGYFVGTCSINNSYYDKEIYGQEDTDKGVGLTSSELQALVTKVSDNNISFQVGTNSDSTSQISINTAFGLNISALRGIGRGGNYLSLIDYYNSAISAKQTDYGAVSNRLESALEEITTQYDNLVSSRSTLRDADVAKLSAEYIQQQILQQASATLLATANQTPSLALQLL